MTNQENTAQDGAAKPKKYLLYSEEDMAECLLAWCISENPTTSIKSILDAHFAKTGSSVAMTTLYAHFAAPVDLGAVTIDENGVAIGVLTSLKEIQAAVRKFVRSRAFAKSSAEFKAEMVAFKTQAKAVISSLTIQKKETKKAQLRDLHQRNCLLTPSEEQWLFKLCTSLAKSGHGLDREKVLHCMNRTCEGNFSFHAVDGFLKRHPKLKLRGSSGIDGARARQANKYVRDNYFCKLDAFIDSLFGMDLLKWKSFKDIPARCIYNMDELGSDTTKRRTKIVTDSEVDARNFTITPEGDKMPFHVTVCLTSRADGQYQCPRDGIEEGACPPVVIHSKAKPTNPKDTIDPYSVTDKQVQGLARPIPGKSAREAYETENDLGFLALAAPNGSMTQCTMLPFAEHFVDNLPADRDPDEGIILLMDGHSSRWDLPALIHFFNNKVYCFFYPSHSSIWSQTNDNGPNQRLHNLIESEAKKRRGEHCCSNQKFQPSDWNIIFREAWYKFIAQERQDYRVSQTNATTNANLKTGIFPFNPNCSSWTDAIDTVGNSSAENHLRFSVSYEIRTALDTRPEDELTELESQQLFEGYVASSIATTGKPKLFRAATHRAKGMLVRWRKKYDEARNKLLQSLQALDEEGVHGFDIDDESTYTPEQHELLAQLEDLHPTSFGTTPGDKVALQIVMFSVCDINALPMPDVVSAKQKRAEHVRRVMDQIVLTHSIQVQKVEMVDGQFFAAVTAGTATKLATHLWKLTTVDGHGVVSEVNLSTQEITESDGYNVLVESLGVEISEKVRRQQRESDKRARKELQRRREQEAVKAAKAQRSKMLRQEYLKIVSLMKPGVDYTYKQFLHLEKKMTDPFSCDVEIEGTVMKAFANAHEAGAFDLTVHKLVTNELLGKRPASDENRNGAKRQKSGRFYPTISAGDGISAVETLQRHDNAKNREKQKKEMKAIKKEKDALEKLLTELKKFQQKNPSSYFNVEGSGVKTHVTLIYRLFGGEQHSKQSLERMKEHIAKLKVDSNTAQAAMAKLDAKASELSAEFHAIGLLVAAAEAAAAAAAVVDGTDAVGEGSAAAVQGSVAETEVAVVAAAVGEVYAAAAQGSAAAAQGSVAETEAAVAAAAVGEGSAAAAQGSAPPASATAAAAEGSTAVVAAAAFTELDNCDLLPKFDASEIGELLAAWAEEEAIEFDLTIGYSSDLDIA